MRAIVIDRSKPMRVLLWGVLVQRGFEVTCVATPRDAMNSPENADVVLVEWDLCDPEVPAFISRIGRRRGARSLFVVMADCEPSPRTVLRAGTAGAHRILVKPFTCAQLDSALLDGLFACNSQCSATPAILY